MGENHFRKKLGFFILDECNENIAMDILKLKDIFWKQYYFIYIIQIVIF